MGVRRTGFAATVALAAAVLLAGPALAADAVRVGVLKFGTVNWELAAMTENRLDAAAGIDVEIVAFAGEDASNVAIQTGDVDVIVSDWLWVSRMRNEGSDLTFAPYSTSVGSLMVKADSPVRTLADLKGRTIGVAGGPLDKNWLLIQGLARKATGVDLAREAEIVYGAPPLLSEKAASGELDAVLTYWHFCARLEAAGFRPVVSAEEAARGLADVGAVSALGYVFSEAWAARNPAAAAGLVAASKATKDLLLASDAAWERLRDSGVIRDEGAAFVALRDRYRDGIPKRPVEEEEADAATLYGVLAELGGADLVGSATEMAPGTFWSGLRPSR
jgi:NitT/TauT family transport system substrate-binding protein